MTHKAKCALYTKIEFQIKFICCSVVEMSNSGSDILMKHMKSSHEINSKLERCYLYIEKVVGAKLSLESHEQDRTSLLCNNIIFRVVM